MVDQKLFQKIFDNERRKLSLFPVRMKLLVLPDQEYLDSLDLDDYAQIQSAFSTEWTKLDDGTFEVQFHPFAYRSPHIFRRAASHELYHIRRDGDKEITLKNYLAHELTAMLYTYTGIQL